MKINEASWDRVVRIVLAVGFAAGAVVSEGVVAVLLVALAAIMLVTGASGRCPIYRVAGLSTCASSSAEV